MIDLSVQEIRIAFEKGDDILRGVTFDVTSGEHVGILGRNGAGKTTLFRVISGELAPDEGVVVTAPGKRVGVLSQIPVYPDGCTGEDVLKTAQRRVERVGEEMDAMAAKMAEGDATADTLRAYDRLSAEFLRLGGYEPRRFRDTVANGLGIPKRQREQEYALLSGGEKTRLNLARLLLEDTDILLLDEPTNHLDMSAAAWLEDTISRFKGTVLVISHDRYFLDRTVSRIIEIADGLPEFYSGNYTFYLAEKRRRYEEKRKQFDKQEAKIAQLQRAADDLHLWGFMGADKLHKRAFSIEKRMERLRTVERPKTQAQMKSRFKEAQFRGDEVLLARGLTKSFSEKKILTDTDLLVEPGEAVALIGDNGAGKSTLLKMIMGEEAPDAGFVRLGPAVKAAYLPQTVTFADENLTVLETMMLGTGCARQEARDRLAAFLFRGDEVFTEVRALSGGERSRLKLCMLMRSDINFLILDEPTNHLDVASREWIEGALEDYTETLLFVSHDRYFINRFATRVWAMADGEVRDFRMGFEEYQSYLDRQRQLTPAPAAVAEKAPKPEKKPSNSKEKSAARLEREIARLEARLAENEAGQEAAATDYQRLMELDAEKQALKGKLEELYRAWEELMT